MRSVETTRTCQHTAGIAAVVAQARDLIMRPALLIAVLLEVGAIGFRGRGRCARIHVRALKQGEGARNQSGRRNG